jgi:pimeloyl-ACP methyl ester carboxylesterase
MCETVFSGETLPLAGAPGEPALLVRRIAGDGSPVLYVHGATFPSALSVAYRFDGWSWMDDLAARGFDVWAFDFAGYGGSERPAGFAQPAEAQAPIGRADEACAQLARVVEHILDLTGRARVSLIAHSWGTIVAGLYATRRPHRVGRLALFGPIAQRDGGPASSSPPAWRLVTIAQQLARFIEDAPANHAPVLIEPTLAQWGPAYLASDPGASARAPDPAVKVSNGPSADIAAAWSGSLAYDPARVEAPTLIVRGAWDSLCGDDDAAWLIARLGAPARDVVIPEGTHLMHLERSRAGLFDATGAFLAQEMI